MGVGLPKSAFRCRFQTAIGCCNYKLLCWAQLEKANWLVRWVPWSWTKVKNRWSVVNTSNAIKTRSFLLYWYKSDGNLITVQMIAGVKVTGAWHRLLWGTGEVWVLMLNEKLKQYTDKSESSDAERRCGRIGSSDEPAVWQRSEGILLSTLPKSG